MSYIGKSIAVLFGVLLLSGFFAGICFADSFTISGTVWDMVPEGGPEVVEGVSIILYEITTVQNDLKTGFWTS